jgi:hypothetical protein
MPSCYCDINFSRHFTTLRVDKLKGQRFGIVKKKIHGFSDVQIECITQSNRTIMSDAMYCSNRITLVVDGMKYTDKYVNENMDELKVIDIIIG